MDVKTENFAAEIYAAVLKRLAEEQQLDPATLFHPKSNPDGLVYKDSVFGLPLAKADDDADDDDLIEFDVVASDESEDRMRDIIRAAGWEFDNFRANNIILRQHNSNKPVGTAPKLWQEGAKTLATIRMAEAGSTTDVDETRSLVRQKVLKAVSVGFRALEWAFMDNGGIDFKRQELTEISIVSVGANANALMVSRAFGCSPAQLRQLAPPAQLRAHRPRLLAQRLRYLNLQAA